MARRLILAVLCAALALSSASSASASSSDQQTRQEKIDHLRLTRRRDPQQCLTLGFVTSQLECATCEKIKTDLVADGVSHVDTSDAYDDNDIYNQCLSCCSRTKLEGDALSLPSDSSAALSSSTTTSAAASSSSSSSSQAAPLPYVLPDAPSYWRARLEISMIVFEQNNEEWTRLIKKLPTLFPFTTRDTEIETAAIEAATADPTAADDSKGGNKGSKAGAKKKAVTKKKGDSLAPSHATSLVDAFPAYQRHSVIYLYKEGQLTPVGGPERLERRGDEAAMDIMTNGWDANKVEEFLNNTISGSLKRQEIDAAQKKKKAEDDEKAAAAARSESKSIRDEL